MNRFWNIVVLCALIAGVMWLGGCKKNQAPGLTIEAPVEMQDVATNDSILIRGVATDDRDLHEFAIVVTNVAGDTVAIDTPYVHGAKSFEFNYYFAPVDTGIYNVSITAYDHDLDWMRKDVTIHASLPARLIVTEPNEGDTIALSTPFILVKGFGDHNIGLRKLRVVSINNLTRDTVFKKTENASTNPYYFNVFVPTTDTGTFNLNVAITNYKDEATTKVIRYYVR